MALSSAVAFAAPAAREFNGLKAATNFGKVQSVAVLPKSVAGKGALGARCDYFGSPTNLIVVGSTALLLFAGRFGLAPSANKKALAGLQLVERPSGLQTGDPAGFTFADTLAFGAVGHIIAVGIVLGLKATGGL
jgi:photosystem I subunit 10